MTENSTSPARRRNPDILTLACGVLALAVSAYLLLGASWNLQWTLAAGAVGVGVLMLIASARPSRRTRE